MAENKFKLKPGINNCTNEEYHGDKSYLSSSNYKLVLRDPEKFKKEVIDGERENKQVNAFDEGTYAHSLILEPEMIPDEFAFFPGFRKAGKDFEQFKDSNKGKIILSKPQKHRVEMWVDSYRQRPEAVSLISGGEPEQSLAGELLGVPSKVRCDYINVEKGYVVDIKTTSHSTDVESFSYVIKSLGYDLSAAMYLKMFEEYYKKSLDFYFVVLGKRDNMCEVYKLSEDTRARGDLMLIEAVKKYKDCLKTDNWINQNKVINIRNDYEILEV